MAKPLTDHLTQQAQLRTPDQNGSMPWEMNGEDLCRIVLKQALIGEGAANYKVVIDATYGRRDAILFELCHVWGYSAPKWTPLLLRLCTLCDDGNRPNGPATPLERFELSTQFGSPNEFVHEFLYLQWGYQGGTQRNWGRMGYTNAALLWPPALEHLLGKIGFNRTE
ncbi:MAG: hypothetical protein ABSG25_10690 [Bryobacteraceae bacterium]